MSIISSTLNEPTINTDLRFVVENEEDAIHIFLYIPDKERYVCLLNINTLDIDSFLSYEIEDTMNSLNREEKESLEEFVLDIEDSDMVITFESIATDEDHRGNKYASALIDYSLNYIKKEYSDCDFFINMNACAFGMDFTMLDQESLVRFYKRKGFETYLDQGGNSLMSIQDISTIKPYINHTKNLITENNPIASP